MKKEDLTPEELKKYSDEFWEEGSFVQSMSSDDLNQKIRTIRQSHDENMNFNCKKCSKKISAHNKDWHDALCDECFNKIYFSGDKED